MSRRWALGHWAHLVHRGEPGAGAQQAYRLLAVERVLRLYVEADVLEPDLGAQLEAVQPLRDGAAVVPLDAKLKLTEHRVVGHGRVRADGIRPIEIVLAVRATTPARRLEEDAGADRQRERLALRQAEGVDRRVVVVLALGDQRQVDERCGNDARRSILKSLVGHLCGSRRFAAWAGGGGIGEANPNPNQRPTAQLRPTWLAIVTGRARPDEPEVVGGVQGW